MSRQTAVTGRNDSNMAGIVDPNRLNLEAMAVIVHFVCFPVKTRDGFFIGWSRRTLECGKAAYRRVQKAPPDPAYC